MTIYDLLYQSVQCALAHEEITPEQARITSKWLAISEQLDETAR